MGVVLTSLVAIMISSWQTPPRDDLRAAIAAVADVRRSVSERRAALTLSISLRREVLRSADASARSTLALDQAEALALVGPSLDATDVFALAGLLEPSEAQSLGAALDEAGALLATVPEIKAADKTRKAILATVLAARRIDLAAQRGEPLEIAASADDALAAKLVSPARESVRLALARIALVARPADAAALLDIVANTVDAPTLLRTAARALGVIGSAERGDADADSTGRALARSVATLDAPSRLLVGDALARAARTRRVSLGDAILVWAALPSAAPKGDASSLRAAVVRRVRTVVPVPSLADAAIGSPLVLAAFAPTLAQKDAAATELALRTTLDALPTTDPLRSLVRYEHARALALTAKYAEAADSFLLLSTSESADPLAADAIDLAIEIAVELGRAANSDDAARTRANTALSVGLGQFFDHPSHERWLLLKGELALDVDRLAEARRAFARVGTSADARLGEALTWIADADATRSASDRTNALTAATRCLSRAGEAPSGRRSIIEAWRFLIESDGVSAIERLHSAFGDKHLAASDLRRALRLLFRAQASAGLAASLSPEALERVTAAPNVAQLVIFDYVRSTLAQLRAVSAGDRPANAEHRLGSLLPLPAAVLSNATSDDRILLAKAFLAVSRNAEAFAITSSLIAESPDDSERRLLHARAAEADHRAEAGALYRSIVASAGEGSAAWWQAQVGELRLLEPAATLSADAARGVSDTILARVNRLRHRDPALGGEETASALESLAARVTPRSSIGSSEPSPR